MTIEQQKQYNGAVTMLRDLRNQLLEEAKPSALAPFENLNRDDVPTIRKLDEALDFLAPEPIQFNSGAIISDLPNKNY